MAGNDTTAMRAGADRALLLHALLILIVVGASYASAFGNGFVTDDFGLLRDNPNVRDWGRLGRIFTTGYWEAEGWTGGLYRPLTIASFLLEYTAGAGNSPFVYHLDNVILHFACSLLAYLLLTGIYGNRRVPLLAALLFAAHPVHAEAVAWISGRAELLWAAFGLASMLVFTRLAKRKWALPLAAVLYLFAIFSKESAVVVPALLAVYLLLFTVPRAGEHRFLQLLRKLWPYAAVTALFLAVKLAVLGELGPGETEQALVLHTPYERLLIMCRALYEYIRIGFFPAGLSNDYLFPPPESALDARVMLPVALLALGAALAPRMINRSRQASFAVAWFLVGLLPVSNIVPTGIIMSDRAMYIPVLGVCMLAGAAFDKAYRPKSPAAGLALVPAFALFLPVLGSFTALTLDRNPAWRSQDSLAAVYIQRLRDGVALYPDYAPLYRRLARVQFRFMPYGADVEKSILAAYNMIGPDDPEMREMMSYVYSNKGMTGAALDEMLAAIDMVPDHAPYRYTAARLLATMKRYEEALAMTDEAVRLNPSEDDYHMLRADLLMELGREGEALGEYETVTMLNPGSHDGYLLQGIILDSQGRFGEAIERISTAVALRPDIPDLHYFLAVAYLDAGMHGQAAAELDRALALKPDYEDAARLRASLRGGASTPAPPPVRP